MKVQHDVLSFEIIENETENFSRDFYNFLPNLSREEIVSLITLSSSQNQYTFLIKILEAVTLTETEITEVVQNVIVSGDTTVLKVLIGFFGKSDYVRLVSGALQFSNYKNKPEMKEIIWDFCQCEYCS